MLLKKWKDRPITIGEFEDLWEENRRFEGAGMLLYLLREAGSIPQEEKIRFLGNLIEESLFQSKNGLLYEKDVRNQKLKAIATKIFLELLPTWNDQFERECKIVVSQLGKISPEERRGWEHKIKTFLRSFLNTKRKKDYGNFFLEDLNRALINNRMFNELVNYDFSDELLMNQDYGLKGFLFGDKGYLSVDLSIALKNPQNLKKAIIKAFKEGKELHALSVFLHLLAKRGDLEKIFE